MSEPMKQWIEGLTGNYSSSAKIVDGSLILSLPDALTPVVWRMDLGQAKASALEVREREDGTFILVLKTPRGDINDIAPFAGRNRAVGALMAVSRAMAHAHGQLRPANDRNLPVPVGHAHPAPRSPGKHQGRGRWVGNLIGIIVLLGLIYILASIGPRPAGNLAGLGTGAPFAAGAPGGTNNTPGVPMSADDFLRTRP